MNLEKPIEFDSDRDADDRGDGVQETPPAVAVQLSIITGEGKPHNRVVDSFPATVGRDASCDIVVDDARVSRRHLTLELEDQQVIARDQGSANGFRVGDERCTERRLRRRDEIRIGSTRLAVVEVRRPKREGASAPLARTTQRRRYRVAGTLFLIVAALSGVTYAIVSADKQKPGVVAEDAESRARTRVAEFAARVTRAPEITAELLSECERLEADLSEVRFVGRDPLRPLLSGIRNRYRTETQNRLTALARTLDDHLTQRRFADALGLIDETRNSVARSPQWSGVRGILDARAQRVVDAHQELNRRIVLHVEAEDWREALRLYESAIQDFAGTAHADGFRQQRDDYVPIAKKLEQRERAVVVVDAEIEFTAYQEETLLAPVVYGLIQGGAIATREYEFGVCRGRVTGMQRDMALKLETLERSRVIPFENVPRSTQLQMIIDGGTGEALLRGGEVAYRWGRVSIADRLLRQFLREDATHQRQQQVNEVIAYARGFDEVPEGGYEYVAGVGWQDETGRALAASSAEVEALIAELATDVDSARLEAIVARLLELQAEIGSSSRVQFRVGANAIGALQELEHQLLAQAAEQLEKPFHKMRKFKEQLNAARENALEVIYDITVYLPEDHPDWPKGDRVNGQAKVDELVEKVRYIWSLEGPDLIVPRKIRTVARKIRMIHEKLYPLLDHTPELEESSFLVDLLNNPADYIQWRDFALNSVEAWIVQFSDQVRGYNLKMKHEDVSEKDRAHVQHVNDYRQMMGRVRTFIDPRLCRATRKHSQVCNTAGAIWHDGSDGTPDSRAKAEGFKAPVGENVAMGYANPVDIWDRGWYRASDHHRNGLAAGWNCMGYGYVGQVGTQNFAKIKAPWE